VLHSNNGATLKETTVLAMPHWLGVKRSHSRPWVSDDFDNALFRTVNYRSEFPLKGFADSAGRKRMDRPLRVLVQQ
jgi:hypothetical protein